EQYGQERRQNVRVAVVDGVPDGDRGGAEHRRSGARTWRARSRHVRRLHDPSHALQRTFSVTGTIQVIVVLVVAVAFAWLTWRAWALHNTALRIVAGILTTLITLVLAIVAAVGLIGTFRINTPHGAPA